MPATVIVVNGTTPSDLVPVNSKTGALISGHQSRRVRIPRRADASSKAVAAIEET
jgi:hypothetical protein